MSLLNQFKGIVPPVVTPYTPDNQIDFKSLRRVVRHLIDGGVHGLFMLGSTSECVLLNEDERRAILDCALEEVNGQIPVVAGVMDTATDMCLRHARQAKAAGVQGLVVTAPFYTRTSQAETIDHFRFIKDEITLPLVAYDIPVCVGLKLQRDTIHQMVDEGLVVALKDSSGDEGNFRMLLRDFQSNPNFRLFTGSEIVVDYAILAGAHGCVPGLGNVDPAAYVRLYDAATAGRLADAKREQERLIDLFQMVFWSVPDVSPGASGVGSFKVAMQQMGIIDNGAMRRPNRALPDAVQTRIRAHLKTHQLLT